MYPLIETIKIQNGTPMNLQSHQERLDDSYQKIYKSESGFILNDIISVPKEFTSGIVKLRFLYNRKSFKIEYQNYIKKKIKTLKIIHDNNIYYPLKFTDRSCLAQLLKQKQNCDDILIIKNGMITDSSYTNIVFFDSKEWITPTTPLLQGTAITKLIKENKIKEKPIKLEDISKFKSFKLINAMIDFEEQKALDIKNIIF